MKYLKIIFCLLFFTNCVAGFAQQNIVPDSILAKTLPDLEKGYYANYKNDSIALFYAKVYLAKAKKTKDSLKIAKGYDLHVLLYELEDALLYCDSIVLFTKNSTSTNYPAKAFLLKGYLYMISGESQKSLDNYLIGEEYAVKNKSVIHQFQAKNEIASIKSMWGEYNEALESYKESIQLFETNPEIPFREDQYLYTIYNLALCYQRSKKFDSAKITLEKGKLHSIKANDLYYKRKFKFSSAINNYFLKDYNLALDSLKSVNPHLKGFSLAINHYYQGMIYKKTNEEFAKNHFLIVDSLYAISQDEFPELRIVYENLVDYYEGRNNTKTQLLFIKKLLDVDSLLDVNREYMFQETIKRYDKPLLIREKDRLVKELKIQNRQKQIIILLAVISLLSIGAILYIQFRKKILYKQKLENLLSQSSASLKEENNTPKESNLNINPEIVNHILQKLEKFENQLLFKEKEITASSFAKSINSNTSYLSKTINHFKEKNFSQYLNDLRINYLIQEVKHNPLLRKYTVKALGDEIGFGNTESFSKAFKERTGVPIGYFMKNLAEIVNKSQDL